MSPVVWHRFRVVLLILLALGTAGMFAFALSSQSARSTTPPAGSRVAFIGDSYTAGTGADSTDERFVDLVATAEGWQSTNFGRGSTGYVSATTGAEAEQGCAATRCPNYRQMIAEVARTRPDAVVVTGGRNDALVPEDEERAAISAFFTELRRRLPDTTIIAVSPVWDSTAPPASLTAMASSVKAAVTAVDGRYVDIGEPLANRPGLITSDGVHPNSAGHARIALAIQKALD